MKNAFLRKMKIIDDTIKNRQNELKILETELIMMKRDHYLREKKIEEEITILRQSIAKSKIEGKTLENFYNEITELNSAEVVNEKES